MFTCKDSVHRLLDFLDGDVTPEDEKKLHEHLEGCPPCVDFLRTYRATPGLCKKALRKEMPAEMAAKLTDFLRARMKK